MNASAPQGECSHSYNEPDAHGAIVCRRCGFIAAFVKHEAPTSKMPTFVEQLRAGARYEHSDMTLMDDAADEIERLRKLANHLRHCMECGESDVQYCHDGKPLWDECFGSETAAKGVWTDGGKCWDPLRDPPPECQPSETPAKPIPWHCFPCGAEFPDRASAEQHWQSAHNQNPKD
jgi:DNA-directed RNA polymerase subunit RPC12/RpoP